MSQAMRIIRKACLGAALLALGIQAGQASGNASTTAAAKPDSAAGLNNSKPVERTAGSTPGASAKPAAIKDLESTRKSDETRDQERVKKLKQRIAAAISARSAAKQEYEPGSISTAPSNSGKN